MDNIVDSPTFVDKPASRRVSFASSNFIKKFSIGPEQNTIWDATYEEMIKLDSTHSSENAHGSCVQQTGMLNVYCESEKGEYMENLQCDSTLCGDEIINKENVGILSNKKNVESVEKTSPLKVPKRNRISIKNTVTNETNCRVLSDRTSTSETLMELTQFVIMENVETAANLNGTTYNSSIDYTCPVPVIVIQPFDMELNKEESMEFTQEIPSNVISERINATILTQTNMELSSPIENNLFDKSNSDVALIQNEAPNLNCSRNDSDCIEMDFTTPISNIELFENKVHKSALLQNRKFDEPTAKTNQSTPYIEDEKDAVCSTTTKIAEDIFSKTSEERVYKSILRNKTIPKALKSEENRTLSDEANTPLPALYESKCIEQNDCKISEFETDCMEMDFTTPINNLELLQNSMYKLKLHQNPESNELTIDQNSKITSNVERICTIQTKIGKHVSPKKHNRKVNQEKCTKITVNDNMYKNILRNKTVTETLEGEIDRTSPKDSKLTSQQNVIPGNQNKYFLRSTSKVVQYIQSPNLNNETGSIEMEFTTPMSNIQKDLAINHSDKIMATIEGENNAKIKTATNINATLFSQINEETVNQEECIKKTSNDTKLKSILRNSTLKGKENRTLSEETPILNVSKDIGNENLKSITQENISHPNQNKNFLIINSTSEMVEEQPSLKVLKDKNSIAEPSSSIDRLSLSLCTDDTEHLINYNLSNQQSKSDFSKIITGDLKPSSFINSKILALSSFSSDVFPVSLENTQVKEPNKSFGLQSTYVVGRDLSENIPLPKKINLNHSNGDKKSVEELRISQENITFSDSVSSERDIKTTEFLKSLKNNESIIDFGEFDKSIENLSVENKSLTKTIEEKSRDALQLLSHTLKECNIEEIEIGKKSNLSNFNYNETTNNNTQNSLLTETISDVTGNLEKTLTIEEHIEKKYKRSKKYLRILSVKGDLCKIDTLFKTLQVDVYFMKESGLINSMEVHHKLSDASEPIALLLHKNFTERLKEKAIKSAIGKKYDILSLLDYIQLNMEKTLNILEDYKFLQMRYNCDMDKSFRAKFYIINLKYTWCISVDMNDLDNISEKSISFSAEIGTINNIEIKKCFNSNFKGLTFLKNFLNDVKIYSMQS